MATAGPAPAVSVVMATYRGAALVGQTIESLFAQTMPDWELIAVDDCSPDDTLAVLRSFGDPRIRIVAQEQNRGPVHTRNHAFGLARGRYIAGLDQDDICLPERFERQLAYLERHPRTVMVATAADLLEEGRVRPSALPGATTPALIGWLLRIVNPLVWSSVMIRGEATRALTPFTRPEILYAEDFDLYHRLLPFGALARIDDPLLLYRVHGGGISKQNEERMIANAARVLAEAYAPLFGADAQENATIVTKHLGSGEPIDGPVLARLVHILARLLDDYRAATPLSAGDEALIARETSTLWWRAVRGGVRSGLLALGPALSAASAIPWLRPHPSLDLRLSQLIGGGRRLRAALCRAD